MTTDKFVKELGASNDNIFYSIKEFDIPSIQKTKYSNLTSDQKLALKELLNYQFIVTDEDLMSVTVDGGKQIAFLNLFSEEYGYRIYLVDSSGYGYARYITELTDLPDDFLDLIANSQMNQKNDGDKDGDNDVESSEITLEQIAKDLLNIAFLPKEERAERLSNLNFMLHNISTNELPKEQNDLIHSIVNDLINENQSKKLEKIDDIEGLNDFLEDLEEDLEGFDELKNELKELENLE